MVSFNKIKTMFFASALGLSLATLVGGNDASADGVRMTSGSYVKIKDIAQDYKAPVKVTEVIGLAGSPYPHFYNNRHKIYATRPNLHGLIYGKDMPFYLRDQETGMLYPGYCAQSWVTASKSMSVGGLVTDPKLLKLVLAGTTGRVDQPAQHDHIALQTVLWGALNEKWSADLFSANKVSAKSSAYPRMQNVHASVSRIASQWSDIISDSEPIKPIAVKTKNFKAAKPKKKVVAGGETCPTTTVVAVEFASADGSALPKGKEEYTDITYDSLPAGWVKLSRASDSQKILDHGYKVAPRFEYFEVPLTPEEQEVTIKGKIKYKGKHEILNEIALAVYNGSSGNQPFLMPREAKKTLEFSVTIPKGDCEEPPPDEPEPTPSLSTVVPLRWHNMPSAFGEIKDGVGFNNYGVTGTGTYATTRAEEEFEAMLGVPSTERFYVNLGGTEGFIDVKYHHVTMDESYTVKWKSEYEKWTTCGSAETGLYPCLVCKGNDPYTKTFKWKQVALNLVEASFRVFDYGTVNQEDLAIEMTIDNEVSKPGTFDLSNGKAREQGPGTGSSTYIMGAENDFKREVGFYQYGVHNKCGTTESDDKDKAYAEGNAEIGELFAVNDSLTITIMDTEYKIVVSENKKSNVPFDEGASPKVLDASYEGGNLGGGSVPEGIKYFKPLGELWDVWGKIPVTGYNGNPEDDGERSKASPGAGGTDTPLLKENIPIEHTKQNGIYDFNNTEELNILDYSTTAQVVWATQHDLHEDVSLLEDGFNKGTATVYPSAKDPINKEHYLKDNTVKLQYTNWNVPVETAGDYQFKHSGNEPDDNHDDSLEDNPTYYSINPVLIHNPTTTMLSWVADIPNAEMQDQRINGGDETISTHPSVNNDGANPRLYIDYDFQLTIPNDATFNKYWGQTSGTSEETGIEDLDYTNPGTLGKVFLDTRDVTKYSGRFPTNPYSSPASGSQPGGDATWAVNKWMTAKYAKFPFDVYYYKNSGESGGDQAGWYDAGTWIKLYDDLSMPSKVDDPTAFNFHVGSNTKDISNGIIYVSSEAINAPDGVKGDPEGLYSSGEQYVNGTRFAKDEAIGSSSAKYYGEASHSAANQMNLDVVGRIGNLAVSDATDPAWSSVFWNTDNKGKPITTQAVQKNYGLTYNMYENSILPNGTEYPGYDRFKSLNQWYGEMQPAYTLPLRTNPVGRGQSEQAVKLGYTIRGNLQTVGDYGFHGSSSMWIYPQNQLAGAYKTGNPSTPFKLITSDQYTPGAKYMEYYDSNVNNTLHGNGGVIGKYYSPAYKHILSSSLADNRMKLGGWEKSNANYQKAIQQGAQKKIITGTPSWIEIPLELRTEIGSNMTQGRFGNKHINAGNGNNAEGAKSADGSCKCTESYVNAHKWNWTYSLPQDTKVWFNQQTKNGSPVFEAPIKDQYIITSMAFRTKVARSTFPGSGDSWQEGLMIPGVNYGDNYLVNGGQSVADWDLTMYTNHGVENGGAPVPKITEIAASDPTIGGKYPSNITPSGGDPSGGIVTTPDKYDPAQGGPISNPMVDIVWWNYGKQATTDKDNIGTH